MRRKSLLPEGYRIVEIVLDAGSDLDPYDWGTYTYQLEHWEKTTRGHWWWKREEMAWVPIERSNNERRLMRTAKMMEQTAKMKEKLT